MDDRKNKFTENVNVTMHKAMFSSEDVIYAKVHRETALMGNIVDKIYDKNKVFDRETLLYVAGLFKNGILALLSEGKAVDMLQLGVLYLKPNGTVEEGKLDNIPEMTLGFTPSEVACAAVKGVTVAGDVTKSSEPEVSYLFDMHKEAKTDAVSKGYTLKIKGDRLKIAGDEAETGLFFAPCDAEGKKDEDRANWVHIRPSPSMENTAKTVCVNLPAYMKEGTYRLIVCTAFGAGKRLNKSIREGIYANVVTIQQP